MKNLIVDGQPTSLAAFIRINTKDPDVDHITKEDVKTVKGLKPGEHCFIGVLKIEKLKS